MRLRTRQEQEAAMGQDQGKERGLLAGRKNRMTSPYEWEAVREAVREAARPPEWRKTPGGITRES